MSFGGKRADIVIKDGNIITVIELKNSLSLDLLEQCHDWVGKAHYIYACVPAPKRGYLSPYTKMLLSQDGIGLIHVSPLPDWMKKISEKNKLELGDSVNVILQAKLNRRIIVDWNEFLTEEHKNTLPGGTKGGGYITPYKTMMNRIREYLKDHPQGVSYQRLLHFANDHYVNPRQSLMRALIKIEHSWCRIEKRNKETYCVYYQGKNQK